MRTFLLFVAGLFFSASLLAQAVTELQRVGARKVGGLDSNGWKKTGVFLVNMNQSAQSEWNGGGERFQFGVNAILNKAIHHRKGKYSFDTYFDLELGLTKALTINKLIKSTDRCDVTFEMEHRIGTKGHFFYGILANANTQLFDGFNYTIAGNPKLSSFLSPGKFLLSPGFDYKNDRENSYLSIFFSPATIRWVTKLDNGFYTQSKFGVDSFRSVNTEIGPYVSFHYNAKVSKTSSLISRLDFFSNYKRNPLNVDILFNNVFSIKVSNLFAATFIFDLLYDHDIKRKTQLQQVSGLGLRLRL